MIIFITGGAKNGKSSLAQELTLRLARGGKRYYVATMLPVDEEDRERIRRHIADRDGLGFETWERGRDLAGGLPLVDRNAAFLIDSATALLMNELFPPERNYEPDPQAPRRCREDLCAFVRGVANAVVVSDYIYSDAFRYDEITELYRKGLADIDRSLAAISDTVLEVCGGQIIVHKGELPV